MYSYTWDAETGGLLLNTTPLAFSKEPRPVYYKELDILGFDQYWHYAKDDSFPYMWAEANTYIYRGRIVAKTKSGSLYTAPELIILDEPEPDGQPLRFVDIPAMVEKNRSIMDGLVQDTIKRVNTVYQDFQKKIDIFYVACSGGKDSVVDLDIVQRTLPHEKIIVLFGNTQMESSDTYASIKDIREWCKNEDIVFLESKSSLSPSQTWKLFGPPATTNRWCCSVHKTSPQIELLRNYTGNRDFTGMAFTGIRGDESLSRSEYDDISYGKKHSGQYSCHPILAWNSAELFNYIYERNLIINETYKKGNSRASCLVCPMSSGKHEYMKYALYSPQIDPLLNLISSTSEKNATETEMHELIDIGFWKNRRTGKELNFGSDLFSVDVLKNELTITVFQENFDWREWAKTVGDFQEIQPGIFHCLYKGKTYVISVGSKQGTTIFKLSDSNTSKESIRFSSLLRSIVVKSLYCVHCGVCMADCKTDSIRIIDGQIKIAASCVHCGNCHDIYEHCLRYNSIRNKIGGKQKVKGLDRYYTFGVRKEWMRTYFEFDGSPAFWESNGNSQVDNKKKDAFQHFVEDAGIATYDKNAPGDKYMKYVPTKLVACIKHEKEDVQWAMMLSNLAYTPAYGWYIKNIERFVPYTPDQLRAMLELVMEGDSKGLGKRNVIDSFKNALICTPLGKEIGLGECNYTEKTSSSRTTRSLVDLTRTSWSNPDPRVILYSLYKYAEACDGLYQFTLARLMNFDFESEGVSPAQIFGLDRETMQKLLMGLSVQYPDYISATFTLDLDNINLRDDKQSSDVLELF